LERAKDLARDGRYDDAYELLDAARGRLPVNTGTEDLIAEIEETRRAILLDQAAELANEGEGDAAMEALQTYERNPGDSRSLRDRADKVRDLVENPYAYDIRDVSPGFVEETQRVEDLLVRGRAQFVNGDIEGARQTFALVETISPENVEAKAFLYEIAKRANEEGYLDRTKTRAEMLNQVSRAWQQPRVYVEEREQTDRPPETDQVLQKLENIIIPRVTFSGTSLSRAVQSLSEMSEEFDRQAGGDGVRGVNMVVTEGGTDRQVNFSVRNLSLLRILDIVAQQTGYQWDVVDQVVEFVPSESKGQNNRLQRAIIPISKGTLDLILDIQSAAGGGGGDVADDPFAAPTGPSGPASDQRQDALVNFFEASGINFRDIPGASVVTRGSRLLVNQTSRNIEEIRQTLRELDITDQVEIEAKFMEVVQGNLDELAFQWDVANQGEPLVTRSQSTTTTSTQGSNFNNSNSSSSSRNFSETVTGPPASVNFNDSRSNSSSRNNTRSSSGNSTTTFTSTNAPQFDQFGNQARGPGDKGFTENLSTLATVFGSQTQSQGGTITRPNAPNIDFEVAPGSPANALDLGADIVSNFFTSGVIGQFNLDLLIRAVSRMEGSDLLSAPRVTVMSGKSANIVVAQEFIYPTSYGEPTVTASTGGDDSGSSSVALASGVPEDFEMRNLGVELTVTPTVEPNDKINLALQPRVTEFEGYVSYGGPNIAIGGGSTVQAPSGYFQPIFSTRTVETEVTVFDGATVVLGGLTREEVQEYKEKIPVLGDIPLVGRLFRSEGETAQKRNLLIFVTANLISPGGSPAKQSFDGTESNSLFQNPTLISPGGILSRDKSVDPDE
jgi:general secretion pathway protein D